MKNVEEYLAGLLIASDEQSPASIHNMVFEMEIPHSKIRHSIALGQANADSDAPMTSDHTFHTASITKSMTATIILQLWESGAFGKNGLDTSIAELSVFAPEVLKQLWVKKGISRASSITLRHLLTHTSGLKDPYSDDASGIASDYGDQGAPGSIAARWQAELEKLGAGDSSLDEQTAFIYKKWTPWDPNNADDPDAGMLNYYLHHLGNSPVAMPGERFHYSDTGFVILALIAEKVSGTSYHQLLRRSIFETAEMVDSYLAYAEETDSGSPKNRISDCYAASFPMVTGRFNFSFDWGGGGVVTTARDLNNFLQALIGGRLFKKKQTLDEMLNWKTYPGLTNTKMGLGIFSEEREGITLWGHDGAWGSIMYYAPASDTYISGTINQLFAPPNWVNDLLKQMHKIAK